MNPDYFNSEDDCWYEAELRSWTRLGGNGAHEISYRVDYWPPPIEYMPRDYGSEMRRLKAEISSVVARSQSARLITSSNPATVNMTLFQSLP